MYLYKPFKGILVVVVCLLFTPTLCWGAYAVGYNANLDARNGDIYFPLTPEYSGEYGALVVGVGPDQIGFVGDSKTLVGTTGPSSETFGEIYFLMSFDLTGQVPEGDLIPVGSGLLGLTFLDLDVNPVNMSNRVLYQEILTLSFIPHPSDPCVPIAGAFTLDETNYNNTDFGNGPGPFSTDDVKVTYEIPMGVYLGLTQADMDTARDNNGFMLLVNITSDAQHLFTGQTLFKKGIPEIIDDDFVFSTAPIPEPTMLVLLCSGATLLMWRRRFHG